MIHKCTHQFQYFIESLINGFHFSFPKPNSHFVQKLFFFQKLQKLVDHYPSYPISNLIIVFLFPVLVWDKYTYRIIVMNDSERNEVLIFRPFQQINHSRKVFIFIWFSFTLHIYFNFLINNFINVTTGIKINNFEI